MSSSPDAVAMTFAPRYLAICLQQASSLQIDQHGGVGDKDHCKAAGAGSSMRRLSSRTVMFKSSAVLGPEIAPSASAR
jgi:hypothetical protein